MHHPASEWGVRVLGWIGTIAQAEGTCSKHDDEGEGAAELAITADLCETKYASANTSAAEGPPMVELGTLLTTTTSPNTSGVGQAGVKHGVRDVGGAVCDNAARSDGVGSCMSASVMGICADTTRSRKASRQPV